MKVPVVLPVVHVVVSSDGHLEVDVDGTPRDLGRRMTRSDLRTALDEITADLGVPLRVEVREADGSTYADIAVPPTGSAPTTAPTAETSPLPAPAALASAGFKPGEDVALAYVVARQPADSDGSAAVNLPPALLASLLASTRAGFVMVGMTSRTVTAVETVDGALG